MASTTYETYNFLSNPYHFNSLTSTMQWLPYEPQPPEFPRIRVDFPKEVAEILDNVEVCHRNG